MRVCVSVCACEHACSTPGQLDVREPEREKPGLARKMYLLQKVRTKDALVVTDALDEDHIKWTRRTLAPLEHVSASLPGGVGGVEHRNARLVIRTAPLDQIVWICTRGGVGALTGQLVPLVAAEGRARQDNDAHSPKVAMARASR